jgi:hypothetical protein
VLSEGFSERLSLFPFHFRYPHYLEYQSRRIPGIFESIILYDDNGQSEAISTLAKLLTTEGKVKNIRILKGTLFT